MREISRLAIVAIDASDVAKARTFLDSSRFHRLSIVDATSFVAMKSHAIRKAFAFDVHFVTAGFACIG